ncbi:MAG: tetratricopeptide repeat protein [Anaerotruncus sp.]|nr:tetratricopeptide repeat protein [Anaerotruncus sp.]
MNIPPARTLTLSAPVLGNRVVRNPAFAGQVKPFTFGESQVVPSPRNDFVVQDTLSLYCELGGITGRPAGGRQPPGRARPQRPGRRLDGQGRSRARPTPSASLEDFPLAAFPPDYYAAEVAGPRRGRDGHPVLEDGFLHQPRRRPCRGPGSSISPSAGRRATRPMSNILGLQHFQTGDLARARPLLEGAFRRSPESVPYALDYLPRPATSAKDYDGVQSVALPFYQDRKNFEFAQYLGESAQALGRYAEAIGYYKDYLSSFGTNLGVLNAIGECYVKTGDLGRGADGLEEIPRAQPGPGRDQEEAGRSSRTG